jgi:hypothetical protein
MPPNPKTDLVTLPEVVTGELAGKFGEISLFNHHADFELESASNTNSTSPRAIACEPVAQPSQAVPSPRERSKRGPHILSRARTEAPSSRRAGKEPAPEYNSHSNSVPGHPSDSNPLSEFYSNSAYEFDFGSDPEDSESEDNSTEHSFLVRADLRAGYNIYTGWQIRLLARPQARRPDKWRLTLRRLHRLTPVPGGKYLEDISSDELSADAPANETPADRDARRERNRKRSERRWRPPRQFPCPQPCGSSRGGRE